MRKSILLGIGLGLLSQLALGATVVNQGTGTVQQANCVLVQQNESMVGGLVGGGVGAVAGGLVGSLFGKTGKKLGALAGGVGGAAYGASGSKIYNCTLLVAMPDGSKQMVSKVSDQLINAGQTIGVVAMSDGSSQAL